MKKEYETPLFRKFSVVLRDSLAISIDEDYKESGVIHPTEPNDDDWE